MLRKSLSLMAALTLSPLLMDESKPNPQRYAICILYPNNSDVRGVVSFSQASINDPTNVACAVRGLTPNGKHGIHIHEFGDLTEGCTTAGVHYNPHKKKHGGPEADERHVGDLGNLTADKDGTANVCFSDKVISLFGDYSIVGRSVVVHKKEDDLGKKHDAQSKLTGNSGDRVACGVIGLAKEFRAEPEVQKKEKKQLIDNLCEKEGKSDYFMKFY